MEHNYIPTMVENFKCSYCYDIYDEYEKAANCCKEDGYPPERVKFCTLCGEFVSLDNFNYQHTLKCYLTRTTEFCAIADLARKPDEYELKDNMWVCLNLTSFGDLGNALDWLEQIRYKANIERTFLLMRVVFYNAKRFTPEQQSEINYKLRDAGVFVETYSRETFEASLEDFENEIREDIRFLGQSNV